MYAMLNICNKKEYLKNLNGKIDAKNIEKKQKMTTDVLVATKQYIEPRKNV